jgi:hypothetical protein
MSEAPTYIAATLTMEMTTSLGQLGMRWYISKSRALSTITTIGLKRSTA